MIETKRKSKISEASDRPSSSDWFLPFPAVELCLVEWRECKSQVALEQVYCVSDHILVDDGAYDRLSCISFDNLQTYKTPKISRDRSPAHAISTAFSLAFLSVSRSSPQETTFSHPSWAIALLRHQTAPIQAHLTQLSVPTAQINRRLTRPSHPPSRLHL